MGEGALKGVLLAGEQKDLPEVQGGFSQGQPLGFERLVQMLFSEKDGEVPACLPACLDQQLGLPGDLGRPKEDDAEFTAVRRCGVKKRWGRGLPKAVLRDNSMRSPCGGVQFHGVP